MVFDSAELVLGICAKACAEWSRKQLDAMTDYVNDLGALNLSIVNTIPMVL